ncbi:hypothetical protein D3C85_1351100 [compost metagenome]
MATQAGETASALADLKKIELSNATAVKYADIVEQRAVRLHADLAELLAIVELIAAEPPLDTQEDRRHCLRLITSISLALSPRGGFAEEFNLELGHLREAAINGSAYLKKRQDMLTSFRRKAWMIIDAEYDRALASISTGSAMPRPALSPT